MPTTTLTYLSQTKALIAWHAPRFDDFIDSNDRDRDNGGHCHHPTQTLGPRWQRVITESQGRELVHIEGKDDL